VTLSRVRRLTDLIRFETEQFAKHGMNSDSRKSIFILLCSLAKAELSLVDVILTTSDLALTPGQLQRGCETRDRHVL
jgi:hypothetical protein